MSFEVFDHRRAPTARARFRVSKRKILSVPGWVTDHMGRPRTVLIGFDRDRRILAIFPCENGPNAYVVSYQPGALAGLVTITGALKHFGIEHVAGREFDPVEVPGGWGFEIADDGSEGDHE